MRRLSLLVLPFLLTVGAAAEPVRFPPSDADRLSRIGEGKAVIFSPDLVTPGNREFYERLGFVYLDSADWNHVLDALDCETSAGRRIEIVVVESHGTNGSGLKLQEDKNASALRSYVAAGALQERLGRAGIPYGVISACNAGRLFRPEIYAALVPDPDEPLFLPATLGIVHASASFSREESPARLLRRRQSNLETLIEGRISEFSDATRALLRMEQAEGERFVVSSMLIQLLLGESSLELISSGWETNISRADLSVVEREELFARFVKYVDDVAAREVSGAR